jgi:hypothetical protein
MNTLAKQQFVNLTDFLIRAKQRRNALPDRGGAINRVLQRIEVLEERSHRAQNWVNASRGCSGEHRLRLTIAASQALIRRQRMQIH